jgi:hypothetical protein
MDDINTEPNSYREVVECQEKSGFTDLVVMATLTLKNEKKLGQDFFGIWEQPRVMFTCINPAYHISQLHARLPAQSFTFCLKNQTDGSYRNHSHLVQQSKKGAPTRCCGFPILGSWSQWTTVLLNILSLSHLKLILRYVGDITLS